ncbi:MAG: hypothetical protein EB084_06485 [Proteobacteria bacterium]|nr:hypothetical protein [Pseudomonadota bacterium]
MTLLGAWGYQHYGRGQTGGTTEQLTLKRTDKAVVTKSLLGQGVAEEGAPISAGTTMTTGKSQKTVFQFGTSGSMRVAAQTELTFVGSETTQSGGEKSCFATVDLAKGRLWMVSAGATRWIVRTGVTVVRPTGKAVEITMADNGTCTVTAWQGNAEMSLVKHPDRVVSVGKEQEASFSADGTLTNPHPLSLTKDDPWLAWNLLETLGKEIKEKTVPAGGAGGQK